MPMLLSGMCCKGAILRMMQDRPAFELIELQQQAHVHLQALQVRVRRKQQTYLEELAQTRSSQTDILPKHVKQRCAPLLRQIGVDLDRYARAGDRQTNVAENIAYYP